MSRRQAGLRDRGNEFAAVFELNLPRPTEPAQKVGLSPSKNGVPFTSEWTNSTLLEKYLFVYHKELGFS